MDRVCFTVNGTQHSVGCEVSSDVTLLDYIRNYLGLPGTKYMCREAGCGTCIVSARKPNDSQLAINSCMKPIVACHGWNITTIEGIGNRNTGFHPLQTTLAEDNGSQCGYCSPGWVMSMYSLIKSNPNMTMLEVEKSFGSNICRCTGYRPILEAFKMFAKDAPDQIQITDIEDVHVCKKTEEPCDNFHCKVSEWCYVTYNSIHNDVIEIKLKDNVLWVHVNTVKDIFLILERGGYQSYMLMNGNTAKGVYPINQYPRVIIDISNVQELKGHTIDQNLIINAGNTLTELLDILRNVSKEEYFGYLETLYDHVENIAHIAVRNVGTIAGNLMIKYYHNSFPSDLFLLLETVAAQVTIQNNLGIKSSMTMQQFLKTDMKGKVILNVMLPPLANDYKIFTYKIMPRSQSAHAFVNSGFLFKLNSNNEVKKARIVYGGLSPCFVRANATEKFLVGKNLFTNENLQAALKILNEELVVVEDLPNPSVEYRRKAALGLFYKGLLNLTPISNLHPRFVSGAVNLRETRPVSRGVQVFDTNPSLWPLNQPIPKVEALIQCAGEATYTEDLPSFPNEVFGAFALTAVALGEIVSIDASKALAYPGVIAVYTAKDIPGINAFTPVGLFTAGNEELLCSTQVKYMNQPMAIVVAESRFTAEHAAKLVEASYKNVKEPLINLSQTRNNPKYVKLYNETKATDKGNDVVNVIKGVNTLYGQAHFSMETLVTVVTPSDDGLEVYCSTHWMEGVQIMISKALNMRQNQIDVHTRRVGGSYGIKASRSIMGAISCALAANKLNRPCRFIQPLTVNMRAIGKRHPTITEFETGVNNKGVIQYMNFDIYLNYGYIKDEEVSVLGNTAYGNAYNINRWNYKCFDARTDTPANTWARAPGTFEQIAAAEIIIEKIAYATGLDPLEVKMANLDPKYKDDLTHITNNVIQLSDYKTRREIVNKFNAENRWKKRGLRFSVIRWTPEYALCLDINLSVYRGDGTVVITHGGIEMGQGVNTKAVQVAAYILNIPIDKIIIKENNTVIAPNCQVTGGSVASQNVCTGVQRACEELLRRLQPIRQTMDNPIWEELIAKAYISNVDLQTHGFTRSDEINSVTVYGVALAEVEIDLLTGESEILRVDLCEDVGQSVSPYIDIGQVEGAFMMGLGYWTSENLVYAKTGELLTDRTWNYFVPLARDIPQDWRIYFRKNSYSKEVLFGAKCIGEPPICLAVGVALALREAVVAGRLESGIASTEWYEEDGPHTVERICLMSSTKVTDFKFN